MAWFEPLSKEGFDKYATPPWLLLSDQVIMKAMYLHHGDGFVVKSRNKNIVTIKEAPNKPTDQILNTRYFEIGSKSSGITYIDVYEPNKLTAIPLLEVEVKPFIPLKIAFQFVEDKAGDKTSRQPDIVKKLVDEVEDLFYSAGIYPETTRVAPVKVNITLGDVVRDVKVGKMRETRPGSEREWNEIVRHGDPTADFNVFFVPRADPKDPNEIVSLPLTIGKNCVIEDDGPELKVILPHEVGIFLGGSPTYDPKQNHRLMFSKPGSFTPRTGNFINRFEAHTFYKTLSDLKRVPKNP